jgi:hypothetical protein
LVVELTRTLRCDADAVPAAVRVSDRSPASSWMPVSTIMRTCAGPAPVHVVGEAQSWLSWQARPDVVHVPLKPPPLTFSL